MKDKMSISGNNNKLPKELTEYIHTLLTEVLINGKDLNRFRKWLKKYCDDYKTDFESVNTEIEDFIELIVEYNNNSSKIVRKSLDKSGSNLFLKLNQVEQLVTKYKKTHPTENKVDISVNDIQRKDDWEDTKIEDPIDKRKKETEKRKREKKRLEEENNRRIELDDIRKREKDESLKTAEDLKRNNIIFKVVGLVICLIIGLTLEYEILGLIGLLFIGMIVIFPAADMIFKKD